jgi:transposase
MYANPKQWAAIRQRVLVLGESIRCVSCTERMSRNTVKKMLQFESPPGYARGTRKPKTLRVASLATPPRAKTPTAESSWNAWLATVERGTDESPLPPETHQHLKAALTWGSTKARKKALVVLAQSQGFGIRNISAFLGASRATVKSYLQAFSDTGVDGLFHRAERQKRSDSAELREAIFQMLHEPPSLSGLNRSIWRQKDLRQALADKGISVGHETVRQVLKAGGYRWRSAKVVLTSTDPQYREKLAHVQSILSGLLPTERFFSVDEYGPFAVKMKAGRVLVGPDEAPSVPQWQASKGWLILTAALELSRNQVTHFYSTAKNTKEMIRMIGVLVEEYHDASKLFVSWDAASWHMSKALVSYIEKHNQVAVENSRPLVELAPLPASAQFLNVIESVFSGMARAIIHGSNYESKDAAIKAIDLYFAERNEDFRLNPHRAGNKIWGKERTPSEFSIGHNCKDPAYR